VISGKRFKFDDSQMNTPLFWLAHQTAYASVGESAVIQQQHTTACCKVTHVSSRYRWIGPIHFVYSPVYKARTDV